MEDKCLNKGPASTTNEETRILSKFRELLNKKEATSRCGVIYIYFEMKNYFHFNQSVGLSESPTLSNITIFI